MRNRTFADLDRVVALGGGHGLGRVMSSLSSLGSRLTGIVTTTDNGGSTGRIRRAEGGIAWGDMRNCINQLIAEPSVASAMFEYRFSGNGELSGHNLGNPMLKALDHLSVRPLEAINLIKNENFDVLIYPEGTRSKRTEMSEFHKGSFKIAQKSQAPIIPMVVNNAYKVFEETYKVKKGIDVHLAFLEPIYLDRLDPEDAKNIDEYVKNRIQAKLDEFTRA